VRQTDLEVAVDHGFIKANGRREPISEIEIELKPGDPSGIAMVADRLAQSIPITYAARSKAERGYTLSTDEAAKPVRAVTIDLDPNVSTADALQTIVLSCLDHAASNERAVRAGDPDGIHQMRVGLRRLRATISVFKHLLCGTETEAIKTELKWLTEQLGPARDFDVLIEQRIRPMHRSGPITIEPGGARTRSRSKARRGLRKGKGGSQ
jgi:inorganic triphosphatase YgiF